MMTQDLAIFKAMSAKMGYLDLRQKVLAENIANSDTPDYRAKDVEKPDFGKVLKKTVQSNRMNIFMDTTHPTHIPPPGKIDMSGPEQRKMTYEVSPSENSVSIEEEVIKASKNTMDYSMITNLYSKHMTMMRTALGRGQ